MAPGVDPVLRLQPPPRRTAPAQPLPAKKRRIDGRSSGRRGREWCNPVELGTYDPAAEAQASHAAELGASSKLKHKTMTADYERFSWSRGIDPKVVTAVTASHVANFYKKRLHNFELFESTAKAISAAMTVYFANLGCSGVWQTGLDADQRPTFSGHPNQSEVVKAMKKDHLKAVATKGHVTMPVDPFEIGHAAAYFDKHIAGEASVDPQHLSDLFLAEVSMSLMLRFDEATKIQYVRVEGVWSFVLLTFSLVCAQFVFSLHGLR